MTTHREVLQALAAALPDGAVVPVPREWLVDLLGDVGASPSLSPLVADLTCREVAALLGRADSTVRGWLDAGVLEGYRMRGREWRVTRAALVRFQESEATRRQHPEHDNPAKRKRTDLSAWRRVS